MDFIFFDANGRYFNFLCVYQILYKPVILLVLSSLQTMRWAFMLCTISQLDVLIYNFENMKELVKARNCEINEAFKDEFKKNIVHHCAIIKFVDTIARTFGGQFLLFFLINTIIICTTAVQFFSIPNPLNNIMDLVWIFGYLFIMIIMLYIDCYLGSIITEKGSCLSTIVYCFPWIYLAQDMKKNIIIFIVRNQQDLVINASKLLPISMATFGKADVLGQINLCAPDRFVWRRRRPPLLAVPRGRTNLLNKAPLTRAIRTLNDIAERTDLFCCTLTELTKVALWCICYSCKV
ncbi:jg7454 [Pararge aegeria aegeria]|uniref:Jg7454 protein n=1 Tax=Pararge aegeria aegeria TaxID=348720 RepID=A0A8S4RG00_9NEOP|nr:jg7454 [Pararge aegeria aegeria]